MTKNFAIDLLRFIAISLVTLFHVSRWMGYNTLTFLAPFKHLFKEGGVIGCDLFFCISGFCLALTFRPDTPYFRFIFKRLIKIIPAYYIAIVFWCILISMGIAVKPCGIKDILYHVFFIHGFCKKTQFSISGVFWFLSTLMQLYLLFPLLYKICKKNWKFGALIGIVAYGLFFALFKSGHHSHLLKESVLVNMPCFIFGILLELYAFPIKSKKITIPFLILVLASLFIPTEKLRLLQILKSISLFYVIYLFSDKIEKMPELCKNTIMLLASASFSIYLYNYIFALNQLVVKNGMTLICTTFMVFGFGIMMYFLIEKPIQNLISKARRK